jgi:hypothetical protein
LMTPVELCAACGAPGFPRFDNGKWIHRTIVIEPTGRSPVDGRLMWDIHLIGFQHDFVRSGSSG